MRKTKLLSIIILMILIISTMVVNISAHSVELDPEELISFPSIVYNGEGEISISSSQTGYTLYYQAEEMSKSDYEEYKKIIEEGEEELSIIESEKDKLYEEYLELDKIYEEAVEAYNSKVASGATEEELKSEIEACETAEENWSNKITEHNNKVEEYNNKVKEIQTNANALIPSYDESKWIETKDGKFEYDTSWFSDEKVVTMWAKLVCSDGTTYYDQTIYILLGTKVEVESVSLDKNEINMEVGKDYTLVATVNPTDATNKTIEWSSDNEEVATVVDGKVTAVSAGTAIITAKTIDGGYTATCKVIVQEKEISVNSVSLDKTEIDIEVGKDYTLVATVDPSNATNSSVEWSSDNEEVATVVDGKVTAVSAGTAIITAKTIDGGYTATCKVTVTEREPEKISVNSVSLNKTEINVEKGKNYILIATVNPSNATNSSVEWSSDNEEVATVVYGEITAVSAGTATITVKTADGGHIATCKVNVIEEEVITPEDDKENENKNEDNKENENTDDTTADGKIPQTGSETINVFAILLIGIVGTIGYIKYRKLSDI